MEEFVTLATNQITTMEQEWHLWHRSSTTSKGATGALDGATTVSRSQRSSSPTVAAVFAASVERFSGTLANASARNRHYSVGRQRHRLHSVD